jgi:hypothetical protein
MKKLFFSLLAVWGLVTAAMATGQEGVNPYQTGTISFTNGVYNVTNSFPYSYTITPAVYFYATATNATPITNNFVTMTNFSIGVPTTATNYSVNWIAFAPITRFASGTQNLVTAVPTNIAFPFPYYTAPVVVVTGGITNNTAAVTAVTTTNFTVASQSTQTIEWISVGSWGGAQSDYTGYVPVYNNKTVY